MICLILQGWQKYDNDITCKNDFEWLLTNTIRQVCLKIATKRKKQNVAKLYEREKSICQI